MIGRFFFRFTMGIVGWMFTLLFTGLIIGGIVAYFIFQHFARDLPDYSTLEQYDPPTVTRLYAGDGRLLAEYAKEKRVFIPLNAMPRLVINAFISAEDKNFYQHSGVDPSGIARAVYTNILNYGKDRSLVGGSTITQQVVKNFLLTDEKSLERKIKEAILALRITNVYSKEKILELYLNEIFLGLRSYGVGAAALNYFNKSLDELTIEEAALLAAMPKAPSSYNPNSNYDRAKQRRDWVIERMAEDGYITPQQAAEAKATAIVLKDRDKEEVVDAAFFSEEVRRWLSEKYGEDVLYKGGLVVKTTLDPKLQVIAERALQNVLIEFDRRKGFRGPLATLKSMDSWRDQLKKLEAQYYHKLIEGQELAVVTEVDSKKATLGFVEVKTGILPIELLGWTRRVIRDGVLGPEVNKVSDILEVGDVVIVSPPTEEEKTKLHANDVNRAWGMHQIPAVNGAFVAMDPHTGRVLAMVGGYSARGTGFNRATQANRQPGSSFKPFVYMAGLEYGLTPSTNVLDAPIEMYQGENLPLWKPANFGGDYEGLMTLRYGLEKSKNTVTVRLAQAIGIDRIIEIGKRFGIYDDMPRNYSVVLGSGETTLIRMANAYSMIVNGGKQVHPELIERIDDRHGRAVFRRDTRECRGCNVADISTVTGTVPPLPEDDRAQVTDPRVAYQMVTLLEGVVQRGTGVRAKSLNRPIAGKTGTTNNSIDAWFMGFSPDLVAGVYVGYDIPKTMGSKATGSSVALPAFIEFMEGALKDQPATPFRVPPGIRLTKASVRTGKPPGYQEQEYNNYLRMQQNYYQEMQRRGPGQYVAPPPPPAFENDPGPFIYEAYVQGEPLFVPPTLQEVIDKENKRKARAAGEPYDNGYRQTPQGDYYQMPDRPAPASPTPDILINPDPETGRPSVVIPPTGEPGDPDERGELPWDSNHPRTAGNQLRRYPDLQPAAGAPQRPIPSVPASSQGGASQGTGGLY